MTLALFDLDNTLLQGDSDYSWGQFLVSVGAVNGESYEKANTAFYNDYKAGHLDIEAFLAFSLEPLTRYPRAQLLAWRATFIADCIKPMVKPWAQALLQHHRERGDTLALVTATNSFVTAPIAELLGIGHLIATEPEEHHNAFTGRAQGIPCFRDGKVLRVKAWMEEQDFVWDASTFYSDSHNDLPLLQAVTYPVAVDPDPILLAIATQRGWKIVTTPPSALAKDAK